MPLIQSCLHGVDAVLGSVVTFVPLTSRVKQFPPDTMKRYFPVAGTVHSFADRYLFSI